MNFLIQTNLIYYMKQLYQVHWPSIHDPANPNTGETIILDRQPVTDALIIQNPRGGIEINGQKVPRAYRLIQAKDADLNALGVPGYTYRCYGTTGSFCTGIGLDAFFLRFLSANGDVDRLVHQAPSNGPMLSNFIQPYILMQYDLIGRELRNPYPWLLTTANVGSIAHDSCCEDPANASGTWCGEASTELHFMDNRGILPPEGSNLKCSSEWRRAFFDTSHNLNWTAVLPLTWAEILELAFVHSGSRARATESVIPGMTRPRRRFSLPGDRMNMNYELKPADSVTENKITFPGRCNQTYEGPDRFNPNLANPNYANGRCDDFDDFFASLPKKAQEISGMWSGISQENADILVYNFFTAESTSDVLYKVAKNMFRAPLHGQLPAIMSGSDAVSTALAEAAAASGEAPAAVETYPEVWKDFCPTDETSDGEPARDGRLLNFEGDTPTGAEVVGTEMFRHTVYCGEFDGPSAAAITVPSSAPAENVFPLPADMPAWHTP